MKNWYTVKCIYKWAVYERDSEVVLEQFSQFEERIFLIKAETSDEADELSEKYALEYESEFINPYKQKVKILLIEIVDIFELWDMKISNNTEVYSTLFKATRQQVTDCLDVFYPLNNESDDHLCHIKYNGARVD